MPEINTAPPPPQPVFPPGRYGRRREPRAAGPAARRPAVLVGVAGALFGLVLAVVLFQRYGNPTHRAEVISFQLAEDRVTLRFEVHKPADGTAVCRVWARGRAGDEVGAADVSVPRGGRVVMTYTLATSKPPVTAEVPVCRAAR